MPLERAVQTLFGVINTVSKTADDRSVTVAGLVVYRANHKIARTGAVTKKLASGRCDDAAVVLCHDMIDHGDVRAIVKNDTLLTVMYVYVICDHVLTDNKTVFEALYRHAADNVVVILVA